MISNHLTKSLNPCRRCLWFRIRNTLRVSSWRRSFRSSLDFLHYPCISTFAYVSIGFSPTGSTESWIMVPQWCIKSSLNIEPTAVSSLGVIVHCTKQPTSLIIFRAIMKGHMKTSQLGDCVMNATMIGYSSLATVTPLVHVALRDAILLSCSALSSGLCFPRPRFWFFDMIDPSFDVASNVHMYSGSNFSSSSWRLSSPSILNPSTESFSPPESEKAITNVWIDHIQ